jgi:hypothetical protein
MGSPSLFLSPTISAGILLAAALYCWSYNDNRASGQRLARLNDWPRLNNITIYLCRLCYDENTDSLEQTLIQSEEGLFQYKATPFWWELIIT